MIISISIALRIKCVCVNVYYSILKYLIKLITIKKYK
jgi:hypothetical protein